MNPLHHDYDNPSLVLHEAARSAARFLTQFPLSKAEALARLAESADLGHAAEFIDVQGEGDSAVEAARISFERGPSGPWHLVEVWVNLAQVPATAVEGWHADEDDLAWFVERFKLTPEQARQGRVLEDLSRAGRASNERLKLTSASDFLVSTAEELAQVGRMASCRA